MDSGSGRSSPYLTIAAVTAAVGLAAYAVYFDYKRRNDVDFRKKLKREKKRVQKSVAQEGKEGAAASQTGSPAELKEVLKQLKLEEPPKSSEEKETYFMSQVGLGEQLALQGPAFYLPAAMAFYRALRVYPSPVELIVIYQKTIPEPIFKIVMDLTNTEVESRIAGYYEYFPPKRTNVSVITRPGQMLKQSLIVTKDFAAGEVIYKEHPVVTALDSDLQEKGTYCAQCLRPIEQDISLEVKDSSHTFPQTYCSKPCMLAAKNQTHALLFTLDNPLPPDLAATALPPQASEGRRKAQTKLAQFVKKSGRTTPLLVARFIARQVGIEIQKLGNASLLATKKSPVVVESDFTDAEVTSEGYTLSDHIERLRYLEIERNQEEEKLLIDVLRHALPGLEEFMTAQKHAMISGKMAYNAFGVCYGGGRDDKPQTDRPEDIERTRTPYGTQHQIGSAFYTLSSYLTHSCQPSARPSFSSGTSEISIIANRDLKKGDELTIAFVDVTRHEGQSIAECRRRRRYELARGWRFACTCERCKKEAEGMSLEEKGGADAEEERDESMLEDTAKKNSQIKNPNAADTVE